MRQKITQSIVIATAFVAIVASAFFCHRHLEYLKMHTIPSGLQEFDVKAPVPTCGRWKDTMPKSRDSATYRVYIDARRLYRSKIEWQFTRQELHDVLRDVQAAASNGDWGARALLAYFYRTGLGPLESNHVLDPDPDKMIEIVRTAVGAGQAWGFYDLGVAYENGYGNIPHDDTIAWAYYLRAAELGSPEAQMTLAGAYVKARRWEAEEAMVLCAYRQGHGPAAYDLGLTAELRKDFSAALIFFQAGTRLGSKPSAAALRLIFDPKEWALRDKEEQNALKKLDIAPDPDRKHRYDKFADALAINPDLRLEQLDKVVPLPPAALPPWRSVDDAIAPEADGPPSY